MKRRIFPLVVVLAVPASVLAQEVTLPLDRYEELRARLRPTPTPKLVLPAPFALEAARIDIVIGRQSARVTQRLTVSFFSSEWQSLSLPELGSLTSTRLGTLEGRINADKGWTIVARGRGRHLVRLDSVVSLARDEKAVRPTRTMRVELPPAASVSGTIVTSDGQEDIVLISGGIVRDASTTSRVEFVGAPGDVLEAQVLGEARVPEKVHLPLKFRAVSSTVTEMSRARMRVSARLRVDVHTGQLERLEVAFPNDLDVVSVKPNELGWDISDGKLVITPPVLIKKEMTANVVLTGESREEFDTPLLVPLGASDVQLLTALQVSTDGVSLLADPGSCRRAEAEDLARIHGQEESGAPFFVVSDPSRPPLWTITWSQRTEVLAAQVDRLVVNIVAGTAGLAAYEFWAMVRSSGQTRIRLDPPPGFELINVERDGGPIQPGSSEGGLLIPLGAGMDVQVIHVSGLLSGVSVPAKGELSIPLPATSAPIGRIEVAANLPGQRTYILAHEDKLGTVSDIPQTTSAVSGASDVGLARLTARRRLSTQRGATIFQGVASHVTIQAAWSAFSEKPGPLVVRVKPLKKKERWF